MRIFNKIGELILETESESLSDANLRNANLSNANFRGSDLRNADFSGSDLNGANFRGSDLRGVDFRGSDLRDADLIILQMDGWTAYITTNHIRIGCQSHTLIEWESFTDKEIANMHTTRALDYWKNNKEVIISLCKRFQNKGE